MRVRIRKCPPEGTLEVFDLRRNQFQVGGVYEIGQRLAEILILSGFAEPEVHRLSRAEAAAKKRRRDD